MNFRKVGNASTAPNSILISYPQICPLCDYPDVKTLTERRMKSIESIKPLEEASASAKENLEVLLSSVERDLFELSNTVQSALPNPPSDEEWGAAVQNLNPSIQASIPELKQLLASANDALGEATLSLQSFHKRMSKVETSDLEALKHELDDCVGKYAKAVDLARRYASIVTLLEQAVGSATNEDPDYSLQEKWLSVSSEVDNVVVDIVWEQAKKRAQEELEGIRNDLIRIRQTLLESRRKIFSSEMDSVGRSLRCDDHSSFSKLSIPEPSGRGFPIKIEIKAVLDNGSETREVDALNVFSESQIHALGIAAFITRAKIIGHKMLIFDDPVQSMDEDHFRTFAADLINALLDSGFQVVVLTHNDTFFRRVEFAYYDREDYVTFHIRRSKHNGCQVEDGNRRVSERLKVAEKYADEEKLEDGWRCMRLAMERLYVVVYKKHGPKSFDPVVWSGQTAESMWNNGVGKITEKILPGRARRLREILSMTPPGAHDAHADGIIDLKNAIKDLKSAAHELSVQ